MALITQLELPTGEVFPSAYFKIQKINTANVDYEYFEKSDKENIEEELRWVTRLETEVVMFVWADNMARENRATAIHWFSFKFDYDLDLPTNLYSQAYNHYSKNLKSEYFNV